MRIFLCLVFCLAFLTACASPAASVPSPEGSKSSAVKSGKISLTLFNQIKNGMTYQEVKELIGSEGTVISETVLASTSTIIYFWEGEGSIGANANFTFQDGKLIAKAQFGLA